MSKSKKLTTGTLALLFAATSAFGLAACSNDEGNTNSNNSNNASSPAPGTENNQAAEVDVTEDLQTARQAVLDALAEEHWDQVMLASDVQAPTLKYGLMVMPFTKTAAAKSVSGTVNVDKNGKFVIEAQSAETGIFWQIDQDGKITERPEK